VVSGQADRRDCNKKRTLLSGCAECWKRDEDEKAFRDRAALAGSSQRRSRPPYYQEQNGVAFEHTSQVVQTHAVRDFNPDRNTVNSDDERLLRILAFALTLTS